MSENLREVSEKAGLDDFLGVADAVYGDDPHYCAPFRTGVVASLFRDEFSGRQALWVAEAEGRAVARIAARISPTLRDDAGRPMGMLSFFEAANRPSAVSALLRRAVEWLADRGAGTIIGPMDGDTWHKYRFNIGPFESAPFLMEPYNPSYYADLWTGFGFEVLESYCSKTVDDPAAAEANTERLARRALSHGYALRPIRMDRFRDELSVMYALSRRIFAGNFLYTDIPREEFLSLYDSSRRLIDPDFVWFVRSREGEDVGFVFAFSDCFRAMAAMHGRRTPVGFLRFLWLKGRADAVNIKSLGVVPEHQRTGAAMALMNTVYREAARKRYRHVNLCLMRDGNASARMDGGQGRVIRRYALYSLPPSKWRAA